MSIEPPSERRVERNVVATIVLHDHLQSIIRVLDGFVSRECSGQVIIHLDQGRPAKVESREVAKILSST